MIVSYRCANCGSEFSARRSANRKYCSRSCADVNKPGYHGERHTRLHKIWNGILNRSRGTTDRETAASYQHVDVCREWKDYTVFRQWALQNGYRDGLTIDRIDNAKGYSPSNCRFATRSQQQCNRRKGRWKRGTTSQYKGVCFKKGGWEANVYLNRICYYLGRFKTELEAAEAYDRKAIVLHGEFAVLNLADK